MPIFEFYRVIRYDNRVNVKCQKPRPMPLGLGKGLGKTETHAFRSRDQDQDLCHQVSRPRPVTDELESSRDSRPWSRDHMTDYMYYAYISANFTDIPAIRQLITERTVSINCSIRINYAHYYELD